MPFDLEEYELVEDRLAQFWRDHPYGRVITTLLDERNPKEYIVRAEAYIGNELRNDPPAATGLASEFIDSSRVNRTSALENCETSAIGRALANLGYAAKGKRPSREEMAKVSAAQDPSRSRPAAGEGRGRSTLTATPPTSAGPGPRTGEGDGVGPATLPGTDMLATDQQWANLLAMVDGKTRQAIELLNKANGTAYTYPSARAGATGAELDRVLP